MSPSTRWRTVARSSGKGASACSAAVASPLARCSRASAWAVFGVVRTVQPAQDVARVAEVAGPAQQLGLHQQHPVGEHGWRASRQLGCRCQQGGACALPVTGVGAAKRVERDGGELDVRFGRDRLDLGDTFEPAVEAIGLVPGQRHRRPGEVGGDDLRRDGPARGSVARSTAACASACAASNRFTALGQQHRHLRRRVQGRPQQPAPLVRIDRGAQVFLGLGQVPGPQLGGAGIVEENAAVGIHVPAGQPESSERAWVVGDPRAAARGATKSPRARACPISIKSRTTRRRSAAAAGGRPRGLGYQLPHLPARAEIDAG